MAKLRLPATQVAIESVLQNMPLGLTLSEIVRALPQAPAERTLQNWLSLLTKEGKLQRSGRGRATRYQLVRLEMPPEQFVDTAAIKEYIRQPTSARRPVGYRREFLEEYIPGRTFYLNEIQRNHLRAVGTPKFEIQPIDTYAETLLSRLLVDLSWNSSRLEGNTYSLLETQRLIEIGEAADGKGQLDAQMILNHKAAIEFLVPNSSEIGFNRHTILNIHALIADNLLADSSAAGRLRDIPVGIQHSVFHPLEIPHLIEECFETVLRKVNAIVDPFEQSLFLLAQLPYLQPFDDGNKRVSRLAANIPFITSNLSPISFLDVGSSDYFDALLGVYELNRIELLADLFIWAYERSAAQYTAVRQSMGEPDPFRWRYRDALLMVISEIVKQRLDRETIRKYIAQRVLDSVDKLDIDRFIQVVDTELQNLHDGNIARYKIGLSEYEAWKDVYSLK